jgi:hypothetical protein
MNVIIKAFLFALFFLMTGCGSSTPTTPLSYEVKTIDIADKELYHFDREDTLQMIGLFNTFLSMDTGSYREGKEEIIRAGGAMSYPCYGGGTMQSTASASDLRLDEMYDACVLNDYEEVDGQISFVLDHVENDEKADYSIGNNIVYRAGTDVFEGHYIIRTKTGTDFYRRWDYYLEFTHRSSGRKWAAELHMTQREKGVDINGTVLMDDTSYYTVKLHSDWPWPLTWMGRVEGDALDIVHTDMVRNGLGKLTFQAGGTRLEYLGSNEKFLYVYQSGEETWYAKADPYSEIPEWVTELSDIFPNDYEPLLHLSISSTTTEEGYLSGKHITLSAGYEDSDIFGEYDLHLELVSKPSASKTHLDQSVASYLPSKTTQWNFDMDVDGEYCFRLTLDEYGDKKVSRDTCLNYFDFGLSSHQHALHGYVVDMRYVGRYVYALKNNQLEVMNTNGSVLTTLALPFTANGMAVSDDQATLFIAADRKMVRVTLDNPVHPAVESSFEIPANLGEAVYGEGYVHALAGSTLYSIHESNGTYSSVNGFVDGESNHLFVVPALHAIYGYKNLYDFSPPARVDISGGKANGMRSTLSAAYGEDMWLIQPERILSRKGTFFAPSNDPDHDLEEVGKIHSQHFVVEDGWLSMGISVAASDPDSNQLAVAIGFEKPSCCTSLVMEGRVSVLEIRKLNDPETIVSVYGLKTYWKNEGKYYQCVAEKMQWLSANRLLIVYRATQTEVLDYDPSGDKFLYEIKRL